MDKQRLEHEIRELTANLINRSRKDKAAQAWIDKKELADKAASTLRQMREELIAEIRQKVQVRMEMIFKKLITRHWQVDRVLIDKQYKIRVLDTEGVDNLKTLSAGQTLCLALSYIAAVREITDTNYPMIIDSPFGRVSGIERVWAAEDIPTYLPDTQITILVTDTEYRANNVDFKTGNEIASVRETLKKTDRLDREMMLEMEKISENSSRTVVSKIE